MELLNLQNFKHSGSTIPNSKFTVLPGLCDVHVHFREPGFSYKQTILSGSKAALAGGYTAVCTMPNLNPVPDTTQHLKQQTQIIEKDALLHIYPYGALTMEEKGEKAADLEALAPQVIAFSDDGRGVQSESMMRELMLRCKALKKLIAAHCEDNALVRGGYIHDGDYAATHDHKGICSESEWGPIKRDLRLAKETGCAYHVCHISCRQSVELIRKAKKEGVNVTCETGPHYLVMDDSMLMEHGRFRMNPPIRSKTDKEALIEGVLDGTIDMIATDHAPHSAEEKSRGLAGSAFGVVGLQTAFPVMYTHFVKTGIISLEKLVDLMAIAPRKRFGIPLSDKEQSWWLLDEEWTIDPALFLSQGKATPFEGMRVFGKCINTICK